MFLKPFYTNGVILAHVTPNRRVPRANGKSGLTPVYCPEILSE